MKIPVSHGHLEAALKEAEGALKGGAVFCHPHPIHGGTMHTKAVYRTAQALTGLGLRTLRFNFRGVGCSTGTFDDGIGEQEDVVAALDWLELGGIRNQPVILGGISFGSMVALSAGLEDDRVKALLALGTPVTLYDYGYLAGTRKPVLVVQGEHDEFGSPREVRQALGELGDHITVREVPGAGHLFQGHFDALHRTITEFFSRGPGGGILNG